MPKKDKSVDIPTISVTLPVGMPYEDAPNGVLRKVEVRAFTPADRVKIFPFMKTSPALAGSHLLSLLIVDPELTHRYIHKYLTMADRDILFLEAYKFTRGNLLTFTGSCEDEACRAESLVDIELDKLDITSAPENAFEIVNSEMRYSFEIEGIGQIIMKYPTAIELDPLREKRGNLYEFMYELYSQCFRKFGNLDGPFNKTFVQNLPLNQVDAIEIAVDDNTFGHEKNVPWDCHACGRKNSIVLNMVDFFFHNPKRERGRK